MGGTAAIAAIGAVASIASSVVSMKQSHDQKKEAKAAAAMAANAPQFDAKKEEKKAAIRESEINRARALEETNTIQTSALGNTESTKTKKKTLLGG